MKRQFSAALSRCMGLCSAFMAIKAVSHQIPLQSHTGTIHTVRVSGMPDADAPHLRCLHCAMQNHSIPKDINHPLSTPSPPE